jgi:hypothetical protein
MQRDIPSPRRLPLERGSRIETFRKAIEAAEKDGVKRDAMTLRLTLRDTTMIRRDNTIPVEDISFADGEMKVLKVRVISGGIPESILDVGGDSPVAGA